MPSAANAKSEKPASSEVTDNSPIRQIMTIIEHKIRNLEKRKSKLTSYRDLQKAGKELKADQKVAVAKYDEVAQTLEFARDLSKQVMAIANTAEREAKKQAKKEAWIRNTSETNKIREVLLVLDCLMQMGNSEAREDFLNGTNGAVKLTEEDLKILDDLYPEVTPKHELNEEGQPGFHIQTTKAAEHLYAVIDGKSKEILGTTYAHIKEIVTAIHACGYFDKVVETDAIETEENQDLAVHEGTQEPTPTDASITAPPTYPPPGALPVPPAAVVVPAPAYPLRPLPPITLQEVEHAYFSQQYPQQRPISEVIGSQNFFFLQESEIDSPVGTPQPPPILNQPSPPAPIPTQTFTNQHFVALPPQPHFPSHPEHAPFPGVPMPAPIPPTQPSQHQPVQLTTPPALQSSMDDQQSTMVAEERKEITLNEKHDDEWKESQSPEREDAGDRKVQGQGDGQIRFRRYGRGRGPPNGYRGRGTFQNRNDGYHGRHEYQGRSNKDNYQNRHGKEGYQNRGGYEGYNGNGDTGDSQQNENGGRDRYDNNQSYQGGFKSRGRGGPRGGQRGAPRPARTQYNRKADNIE